MTELVENGKPLRAEELAAFRRAYAEEAGRARVAVIIGSLPTGTPEGFYRELLERTPCPAVLDFRGPGLLGLLDLKPYVVKPNREELSRTAGHSLDDDADLVEAMRGLNRQGAQWVVITEGGKAVWVSSVDRLYRFHPPHARKGGQPDRLRRRPGRRHRLGDPGGPPDRRSRASGRGGGRREPATALSLPLRSRADRRPGRPGPVRAARVVAARSKLNGDYFFAGAGASFCGLTSSAFLAGRAGNGACGSVWYQ